MTDSTSQRLMADVAALGPAHAIDAGILGEYAFVGRQRGPQVAAEMYPSVAAHLRGGCEQCHRDLETLAGLAKRAGPAAARTDAPTPTANAGPVASDEPPLPEPIEIADAVALARVIEAERESLRGPLRPDRAGEVDTRREGARRRQILLVEAALVRQRLAARRLFLDRALAARTPGRPQNPKARLLLDDFAGQVDELGRLAGRLGRLLTDLHRLGDNPSGPARPQSEALVERGHALTRDALAVDRRLVRLQGPLAGMG